ncbi:low temperature requirement protein A [Corynebacterium pelargi]|uniref:Bacterial low temperature requirement A protein (LtrA) n=1 Tax=Corynebacterium pelargi TaxID=1471400 RepID=A0A410W8Y1_9CORY|nr:low temperature requirement protein A [Corynebacterium pelargi]QAU52407.1 Bacterial low temperature requirement A protein (LtrA) [Corynebacterium pelargi]GGG67903.1 membrane protein [Corynebacterium pelargi]
MIHYLKPMRARDPKEAHRTATPLELFFDLVFVIAISIGGGHFHHALIEGHVLHGVIGFVMVFLCIWWAWMNFTWFSTSFDNDDWLFRTLTFVQMLGVLVLAVGSQAFFDGENLLIPIIGFVIMRIALVSQWLRASQCGGDAAKAAKTYAAGLTFAQILWVAWAFIPEHTRVPVFFLLMALELCIPVFAERAGRTTWHPHHITERYGLFTIILLGESLLGSAHAIADAIQEQQHMATLLSLAVAGFVIAAGMWWVYFWPAHHKQIRGLSSALRYGYCHAFIFAAAGAVSAGIETQVGYLSSHSELGFLGSNLAVGIPVAVFLLGVWALLLRGQTPTTLQWAIPLAALLALLLPVWGIAAVMAVLIYLLVRTEAELRAPSTTKH